MTEENVPTVSAVGVAEGKVGSTATPSDNSPNAATWLVAIVKRNSEKTSRDALQAEGIEAYVATQTIMRRYAKRRPKSVEYVRLPAKVFLRMAIPKSPKSRSDFFLKHPYISSFMPDRAKSNRGWAVIPDAQMLKMRNVLGDTENEVGFGFPDDSYVIGGKVRAAGGVLNGLEGFVASRKGKNYFCVEIEGLDWARISIPKERLEPINPK